MPIDVRVVTSDRPSSFRPAGIKPALVEAGGRHYIRFRPGERTQSVPKR